MNDTNDKFGNPAAIETGGLTAHEIAQAEAARVQADAERASTLRVEAEMRTGYNQQPYTKSHEGEK